MFSCKHFGYRFLCLCPYLSLKDLRILSPSRLNKWRVTWQHHKRSSFFIKFQKTNNSKGGEDNTMAQGGGTSFRQSLGGNNAASASTSTGHPSRPSNVIVRLRTATVPTRTIPHVKSQRHWDSCGQACFPSICIDPWAIGLYFIVYWSFDKKSAKRQHDVTSKLLLRSHHIISSLMPCVISHHREKKNAEYCRITYFQRERPHSFAFYCNILLQNTLFYY